MEIWKDVPGYEGYYKVSNYGRIKSTERVTFRKDGLIRRTSEKILSGYDQDTVNLSKDGVREVIQVHRLMMKVFNEKYDSSRHYLYSKPGKKSDPLTKKYGYAARPTSTPLTVTMEDGTTRSFKNLSDMSSKLGVKIPTLKKMIKTGKPTWNVPAKNLRFSEPVVFRNLNTKEAIVLTKAEVNAEQ
jgi:hypothetical protein